MATWVDIWNYKPSTLTSYDANRAATDLPRLNVDPLGLERLQIDLGGTGTRLLKFVKVGAASAAVAANNVLHWTDVNRVNVDTREAQSIQGTGKLNAIAGVGIGVITAGDQGWILRKGLATLTAKAAKVIAIGDAVIGSTTDVKVDAVAAGTAPTNQVIGFAVAAQVGGGGGTSQTYVDL